MSPALKARLRANALQLTDDAASPNYKAGGREAAAEAKELDLVTTYCPDVIRPAVQLHRGATQEEMEIDARIRALDVERGTPRMRRLPYIEARVDVWEVIAGTKAADSRLHWGTVHAAEMRRRERKRLYAYLSSKVRGDHSLLSVYAPLWEKQPVGLKPHASNPAAMWRAFPEYEQACAEIDDDLPTSAVPTSEKHVNFAIGHMWHCARCQQYSARVWKKAPPVTELKEAILPGWVDPGGWSLDPGCYQRLQIHFLRTGFEPRIDPNAQPAQGITRNPQNVYQEFDKMCDYLETLESLPFHVLSKGEYSPPPLSSGLLAVVRENDRRKWEFEGTPYPVRPCLNVKTSGVNDMLYKWPFAMAGPDSACRLLTNLRVKRPLPQGVGGARTTTLHRGGWRSAEAHVDSAHERTSTETRTRCDRIIGPNGTDVPAPQRQLRLREGLEDVRAKRHAEDSREAPRPPPSVLGKEQVSCSGTNRAIAGDIPGLASRRQSFVRDASGEEKTGVGCITQPDTDQRSVIEQDVRAAMQCIQGAKASDPLYMSVTDLTKYYLYLALGRNAQKLCYFSDPRYESKWGGRGRPPSSWKERRSGRQGRWRRFLTCPFGLSPLVAYSSAISGEIGQMLIALGVPNNWFIDDDLQVQRGELPSQASAVVAETVMKWLGFVAKKTKRQGPSRCLRYLGFIFDLDKGELRVTPQHRADLLGRCKRLRKAQQISFDELSRLCGKLNWVAQVMWGAITFIRNLLNLMRQQGDQPNDATVTMTSSANRHLDHWIERLEDEEWEGSWIFPAEHQIPVVCFKSDASGDKMWGYVYGGHLYWCTPIEDELPTTHIQYRELLPLAHAAELLGHLWTNRVVRVGVDNTTVAYAVNRGNSSDEWMQSLLEIIARSSRKHHFVFVAVHVDRRFNHLADLCTRFQVLDEFDALLPHGVTIPDDPERLLSTCPVASPCSRSVVFSLPLTLSVEGV